MKEKTIVCQEWLTRVEEERLIYTGLREDLSQIVTLKLKPEYKYVVSWAWKQRK